MTCTHAHTERGGSGEGGREGDRETERADRGKRDSHTGRQREGARQT